MTATQPDPEGHPIGRRALLRRGSAAVVGTTAVGVGASRYGYAPVGDAEAIAPALLVAGAIGAGVAAEYLTRGVTDYFTGDSDENYEETNADAVHAQIKENALNAYQSDTAVFNSIQNLINSSANFVIAEAKKAAIDVMNNGGTESEAISASEQEISDFYKTQEKNVLAHTTAQFAKFASWIQQANNTTGLTSEDVFTTTEGDFYVSSMTTGTVDYTLVDGSSYSYDYYKIMTYDDQGYICSNEPNDSTIGTNHNPLVRPVDTGEDLLFHDNFQFNSIIDTIQSEYDSISSEMNTWVTNVYAKYQAGEIDTSDLISPSDLIGDSQTQDGYSFAGASLAAMGLQTSDYALEIELVDSEETVEGAIYHSDDSVTSLQKDVQYDPTSDISGSVYLAYNNTEEDKGELVGLDEPFIIRSITDGEGNTYDAANYESKNQQTYTEDISEIQAELEQIRETRETLEEQRDAAAVDDGGTGGAGAGWFEGSSPDVGLIAAVIGVAGVGYALFGQGGSD